ncbi:disease resistance protein RGA2-like [Gossypium arboreum]|uniref:disease resistance protein RGA2-like n=1 Tax=Gossypium arboreum TaxID=29729 RepID=UPI0008191C7E|nr:disease resistance protein RGA2-like [Gossypium arboreum]XP_052884726.1 disease resistance protein RGA2-like [Gossypium arboreum]
MAEAFLSAIAATVLEQIATVVSEEIRMAYNVRNDIEKLKETMSRIQAVLLDAERQQHENESLRRCMWKLKEIFYDAEDVIDDFKCKSLREQVAHDHNISKKVRALTKVPGRPSSLKLPGKLKDINNRLNELATEWDSFNLQQCRENRHDFYTETHSSVNSWDVCGRDEDKEKIVRLLMKPSEDQNFPVVCIVGIGGLGKTTVAKLVYNDDRVICYFDVKIWVSVSGEEFDLPRLLKLMIRSISKEEKCDTSTVEALQHCLRDILIYKSFLLVLDGVWSENQASWIHLRDLLSSMGGLPKSRIIVTIRSMKVASIMSSVEPYELKGLLFEDCLILFKKWAFRDDDEQQHPNLMRIGMEIVEKCEGVPLAVKTLGKQLFTNTKEFDWQFIRECEIWRLEQSKDDILPVLKFSYDHLSSHLQQCFTLLSLYKKNEIYHSHEVIQLWMANGLLEQPKEEQEWEDVGDRYLNELLWRCFIQKETDYGNYFTFKMHNLIHDLALYVSQKECITVKCDPKAVDKNVRHLSFCGSKLLRVPEALKDFKNVRTVLVQEVSEESKRIHESIIDLCVSNFKHLRALRLRCYSPLTTLPNSICSLKHLRDLDLTGCRSMGKLPFSFYKLRCLQKLKISGIPLKYLPDRMESLIELRHLEITIKAKHLKEIREGCWTRLQHLGLIECDNLECLPKGLQYLTSLRRLDLVSCSKLVSLPRSLIFLTRLEDLRVSSCKKINLQMEPTEFDVKRPQLSLKTLSLWDSDELKDFPRLLLQGSSSTLQQIQIGICNNFEVLPTWLRNLTSLRKLEILNCPKLSALPEGMERLTRLRQLTIKQCPNLSIRCRPYVGADWRKIAHVQDRDTPEY